MIAKRAKTTEKEERKCETEKLEKNKLFCERDRRREIGAIE